MTTKRAAIVLSSLISVLSIPAGGCSSSTSNAGATGGDGGAPNPDGGAAACVATGTVHDVLTQVKGPIGRVAFDDKYVYVPGTFTEGAGVELLARGAAPPGMPLASTPLPASTPDLALLVGSDVYFVGALSGAIYKAPKSGGATTYTTVASDYSFITQRRLAADADALYVLAYKGGNAEVDRIPLTGGAPQMLAQLGSGGAWNMALGGTDVWISGGPIGATNVQRIAKTGGSPTVVATGYQCLNGLAVTADAILCADTNNLLRIPKAGGAASTVYGTPPGIDRIEDVVFSDDASIAYVSDAMGQPNEKMSAILRVDVATGATTTLACGLAPPRRLVLGAHDLAWTSSFVSVQTSFDVQMIGL